MGRTVSSSTGNGGPLDTISNPSTTESWTTDGLGNWLSLTTTIGPNPPISTTQTRTFNFQNQIVSISNSVAPVYDKNGNMTEDQHLNGQVFDAWNRLVSVRSGDGNFTVVNYTYDALGRRISESVTSGPSSNRTTTTTDVYFN